MQILCSSIEKLLKFVNNIVNPQFLDLIKHSALQKTHEIRPKNNSGMWKLLILSTLIEKLLKVVNNIVN